LAGHKPSLSAGVKEPRFSYGYAIVSASFLIIMIAWGAQYSFGVFFKPLLNEFGWTRAVTSGAWALNSTLIGFFGILAGRLSDRYGPRAVVTVSGFFVGISYLLMSKVSTVWQIYLFYGVFLGIGLAGVWVPLMSTVARWFFRRRALASGVVTSGVGLGIVIMPPVANRLISSYGWRTSYVIIGAIAMALIVIFAQFLRRDPNQKSLLTDDANAVGTESPNLQIHGFSSREATRTRQFWIIGVIFLFLIACMQTGLVHIVPHATDIGMSAASAATILSVIGIVSIGSRIGMGSIGDVIGSKRVMIIILALISVSFLSLLLVSELWVLYLFAVVFGIAFGAFQAVQSPLVADSFGLRAHGAIFGLLVFAASVGGAIGSFVAGRIFDISGSYHWAFMLCVILGAAALTLTILLKPARK
jgi:MFS family permease